MTQRTPSSLVAMSIKVALLSGMVQFALVTFSRQAAISQNIFSLLAGMLVLSEMFEDTVFPSSPIAIAPATLLRVFGSSSIVYVVLAASGLWYLPTRMAAINLALLLLTIAFGQLSWWLGSHSIPGVDDGTEMGITVVSMGLSVLFGVGSIGCAAVASFKPQLIGTRKSSSWIFGVCLLALVTVNCWITWLEVQTNHSFRLDLA